MIHNSAFSSRYSPVLVFLGVVLAAYLMTGCDATNAGDDVPQLVAPEDGSAADPQATIVLDWDDVEESIGYQVDVVWNSTPDTNSFRIVTLSRLPIVLDDLGTLSWRVRSLFEEDPGSWSDTRSLFVAARQATMPLTHTFAFNSDSYLVGDRITHVENIPFADVVATATQSNPIVMEDIVVALATSGQLSISDPSGTPWDVFSNVEVALVSGSARVVLGGLSEPPSATSNATLEMSAVSAETIFKDATSQLEIAFDVIPRTPRTTAFQVDLDLSFDLFLSQ